MLSFLSLSSLAKIYFHSSYYKLLINYFSGTISIEVEVFLCFFSFSGMDLRNRFS